MGEASPSPGPVPARGIAFIVRVNGLPVMRLLNRTARCAAHGKEPTCCLPRQLPSILFALDSPQPCRLSFRTVRSSVHFSGRLASARPRWRAHFEVLFADPLHGFVSDRAITWRSSHVPPDRRASGYVGSMIWYAHPGSAPQAYSVFCSTRSRSAPGCFNFCSRFSRRSPHRQLRPRHRLRNTSSS